MRAVDEMVSPDYVGRGHWWAEKIGDPGCPGVPPLGKRNHRAGWHGLQDKVVKRSHIDFIVTTLPNARLTVWPDSGHQGVSRDRDKILAAVTGRETSRGHASEPRTMGRSTALPPGGPGRGQYCQRRLKADPLPQCEPVNSRAARNAILIPDSTGEIRRGTLARHDQSDW